MARYRDDVDDDRDYYPREERFRREELGAYDEPFARRAEFQDRERRNEFGRGRFGERAEYENDEPRYSQNRDTWNDRGDRYRDDSRRSSLYDIRGDLGTGRRQKMRAGSSSIVPLNASVRPSCCPETRGI